MTLEPIRCPQCREWANAPVLLNDMYFACCDLCRLRWRLDATKRDAAELERQRLMQYRDAGARR